MLELELPYPPSINHYWRMWRGRMVISREGRAFRTSVCALLAGGGGPRKPPSGGRVALCMDAFPPDRRRRDLDNIQKPVLDALEHAGVYDDDGLIDLLITRRQEPLPSGRVTARLYALPLVCCPLCGTALTHSN
ncbi:MAG: RusA family crossover junction endodeoxyribonuclease [Phycisphaera sp.]|nr:RusA family crossover junction endodeoxyribonuclease [Phycisphaera sp.]